MPDQSHRPEYTSVDDPSVATALEPSRNGHHSILDPYNPPGVPHGLPHVVNFATLSSMDLPIDVRFLIIMIARFADVHGVASVANSTLCEICRIGSHHTVERWISLAADVGILRKEPGKGGKDRKSNSYTFLGEDRHWAPLPVGRPDTNPVVALAHARMVIEQLLVKAARIDDLEAELALLRNGHTNGHSEVTNGNGEPPARPPGDSYENPDSGSSQGIHGAIGHPGVTNGSPQDPPEETPRSYENPDSGSSQGIHGAIGHPGVTNGSPQDPPEETPRSYEIPDPSNSQKTHGAIGHPGVTNGSPQDPPDEAFHSYEIPNPSNSQETHGAIGHSGVTNGSLEEPSEETPHSYETPDSDSSHGTHGAIGHSRVPNGPDERQEYLARRDRVQELVMHHRDYYQRSFDRRGVLGAIEYFSRSAENEQELMRQAGILEVGGDPRQTGTDPPTELGAQSQTSEDSDRYAVGQCPDCGRPFGTYGGAEYCTDCTERRRRESEA